MARRTGQPLTPREVAVLQTYAELGTVPEAAAFLGMRKSTARTHLHSIRLKMNVRSSVQAVAVGLREGVIR